MAVVRYAAEIDNARRFLEQIEPGENVALLFHGDADGCCSGAIMYHTLHHMGKQLVFPVFMEKGESIYSKTLAKRVLAREPSRLIVMDTGSRPKPIIPQIRTMVIDHHRVDEIPPVEVFATSYGIEPEAPTALFTYEICRDFAHLDGLEWIAAIGTAGDIGVDSDLEIVRDARNRYGSKAIRETVSLINAPRRHPDYDIPAAFEALTHADNPLDVAEGAIPETAILKRYRDEVNMEVRRTMRTAPKFSDKWALLAFKSPALVHPLLAISWTGRLKNNIVIGANYGYTEGNVHFSVRTTMDLNLIEELRNVRPIEAEVEYGHGHAQATGGILPRKDFESLLQAMGFDPSEIEPN